MSKVRFQVAYDGPGLAEHGMDVYALAPALLAFGDLVREANTQINGDRAKVNVLVTEDFEHICFNINFEVIQTVFEQIKTLIEQDDVTTAKDILEWLGIIGGPTLIGLLAYLKVRRGRKIDSVTEIQAKDEGGNISIKFEGDQNSVVVHQNVYQMGENPKIRSAAARVLDPLEQEGIDRMEIRQEGEPVREIDKESASDIRRSCAAQIGEEESFEPQILTAHLKVYSPVFEENVDKWRFDYGGKTIYADITETDIASNALQRGYVAVGDLYRVRLQITEHKTEAGQFRNDYKILEVIKFVSTIHSEQITFLGQLDEDDGTQED